MNDGHDDPAADGFHPACRYLGFGPEVARLGCLRYEAIRRSVDPFATDDDRREAATWADDLARAMLAMAPHLWLGLAAVCTRPELPDTVRADLVAELVQMGLATETEAATLSPDRLVPLVRARAAAIGFPSDPGPDEAPPDPPLVA